MSEYILPLFSSEYMIYIVLGTLIGMFAGAMPGLSSGTGVILALPLTFHMDVRVAMSFLVAIYIAAFCAGGLTAIYFNIPGTSSAAITAIDGYPLAQKGKYGEAAGLVIGSSFLGGLLSFIFLYFTINFLGRLATRFGPFELFFTALLGIVCAVGVKSKSPYKSLLSGFFGFLLGTIGYSPTGTVRATFGMMELLDGIPFFPVLIGMLAMSEVFIMVDKEFVLKEEKKTKNRSAFKKIFSGISYVFIKKPLTAVYSSAIGIFLGVVPGAGATLASFLSYSRAREYSKDKEKFGSGVPEGVIAAEAANNASVGGGILTSLALGIPGTATCAILLAALMVHGIQIGPALFARHGDVVYSIIASLFIANCVMLIFAIIIANYYSLILFIPTKYLVPIIIIFCCLGSYMARSSIIDVWIMFFSSILGIAMRLNGYPPLPLVVGVIVSPIADAELIRAFQIYQGRMLFGIFKSPINWVLIGLNLLLLFLIFRQTKSNKAEDIY